MGFKVILVLICIVIALVCTIVIMGAVIRSKDKKISSLSDSLKRQRDILAEIDGVKQTARKEQKIISSGSMAERFKNSIKVLKKHNQDNRREDFE